ncbi:MAG: phosphodiester glycosidase family protein [Leptolyngbyaceae cyanobacterium CSU_1_3]|nr:phosphodiester glycosidase family protein [Leptolyngbyaceae cyanobacterium CSU_1_3]
MRLLNHRYSQKIGWSAIATGVLLLPLLWFGGLHFQRPPQVQESRSLFQGVTYQRSVRSHPRPIMIHVVTIDLMTPGIKPFVTPGDSATSQISTETNARTVSQFVREFKLQLAINANFFYLFREQTPWDYFPRVGDRVNNVGQVISNGNAYSQGNRKWSVLCFAADNRVQILQGGFCPTGTTQAVAGNEVFFANGQPANQGHDPFKDKPYARVAVAIDASGEKLWLILVDGKQRFYSEGMTMAELTQFAQQLGVEAALNLDGGGSTTLAIDTRSGVKVLNAPIHTKVPMRERAVANQLGFYANP